MQAEVIKLDRGFPLVELPDGRQFRCKHATALVKNKSKRAVIGDIVELDIPQDADKALITDILPRRTEFVRKDPTERALPQVLAANFDLVIVAHPVAELNLRRLERELVLACETKSRVLVLLTKSDLVQDAAELQDITSQAKELIGDTPLMLMSSEDPAALEEVRAHIPAGTTAILIGRSGVGKSSLVNLLVGHELQDTQEVREADGKGRHTTVSRETIQIPNGGRVIDMPGVRGLGLWDAQEGIETAFSDIEELAQNCKFRDCKHVNEPGCAVQEALKIGDLSERRFASYKALIQEHEELLRRREEAERIRERRGHPRRRQHK